MRALVYTGRETLDYREVPEPRPEAGEVLIRVMAVGICGSDMHAFLGHDARRPAPLILGHEAAGVSDRAAHRRTETSRPAHCSGFAAPLLSVPRAARAAPS